MMQRSVMRMIEPKLKFKADDGSSFPAWEEKKLSDVAIRVTRKNKDNITDIPLTISSADGLIDQRNFFNKVVASRDMSGYYLLKKGEFAYNKSYSKGYDFGSIKRLDLYDEGALSTLYICFALNGDENSDFYQKYFDSLSWYSELQKICAEGARNHGLLNVPTNDFFEMKLYVPASGQEQQKLADFLSTIDTVINNYNDTIKSWKNRKKGVMQKLFSQEVRFKADDGSDFPDWEEKNLGEVFEISTETNGDRYSKQEVLSVSDEYGVVNQIEHQGRSFAGNDISKYKVVKTGQIIYTRSPLANKPFGIIKIVGKEIGIVSPLYIVNDVRENNCSMFWYYNFDMSERTNNYLKPLVRMGAKHTMNISNEEWLSGKVSVPSLAEQQKIADCLSSLDDVINSYKATLAVWEELKKGLLQQMFV